MFAKYYQSELNYLREAGRDFAAAYPSIAPLLAERRGDPDVERLLEGVSFISAQIRERIDDAVPEFVHRLAELTIPQYVRPLPATSILQFRTELAASRGIRLIPRGTEVSSIEIEGTPCRFRTTWDCELLPLVLQGVELDERISSKPRLRLSFRTNEAGMVLLARKEGFRFFLHGEPQFVATLGLWLDRHLRRLAIVSPGVSEPLELPLTNLRQCGFRRDESLIPWPALCPDTTRYALEAFTLPEKFSFWDLGGLENLKFSKPEFDLLLDFDGPPRLIGHLSADSFRLGCVPIINLFEIDGEPLTVSPLSGRQIIRAAGHSPLHTEVFDIRSVVGIGEKHRTTRTYAPYFAFEQGDEKTPRYAVERKMSPIDAAIDTFLTISPAAHSAINADFESEEETLSLELTCTNRQLPSQLRAGDIREQGRHTPLSLSFQNIVSVSAPCHPALGSAMHWRLVAHLATSRMALTRTESIRALLGLYNFQALVDSPSGKANQSRIEAIREVRAEAATHLILGAPVRGIKVFIELDETRFANRGEAYFFAKVLNAIYAAHTNLNSWTQVITKLFPSKTEYVWEPTQGNSLND
jgi:type VI secretion system protein ImpG